ncbi:MAG: DUF2127 domain-containing protein [Elusimicrobia bacterium]|nr:DUF2127 domain-containing protein [Elusimicrobiota bacterium]
MSAVASSRFVRWIIIYKAVKGFSELLFAGMLGYLLWYGAGPWLAGTLKALRDHLVGAGSLRLADLLLSGGLHRHARLVFWALLADGSFNLAEGWCLLRRYSWGEWVVVLSSGIFLPFELAALLRGVHAGRVIVTLLNLAVIAGLAWRLRSRPRTGL